MNYTIRITETYSTDIVVKADTQQDALVRVDAAMEDDREERLIDHWLSRGYQGRDIQVIMSDPDDSEDHDNWDFVASKELPACKLA